jgi:hypothetical protein
MSGTILGLAAIWLSCGVAVIAADWRRYPDPVAPLADTLLRCVMLFGGPVVALTWLFVMADLDRMDREE